jgi:hypothetical protein
MRFRITTRTQGAGGDPFLWVSDDFVTDGDTVDDAIDKGRALAVVKYPEALVHLVYGAIPTDEALTVTKPARAAKKGKGA